MNNSYPEKPEIPFKKVHIEMGVIIAAIKAANYPVEVKRAAYVIARNETSNGKSVINGTNICGAQGDSGRWPSKFDDKIIATCIKRENKRVDGSGGDIRRFLVFDKLMNGVIFLCDRVEAKGIYIGSNGGKYHIDPVETEEDLADAYQEEWVFGEEHETKEFESKPFISMYEQAKKIFQ